MKVVIGLICFWIGFIFAIGCCAYKETQEKIEQRKQTIECQITEGDMYICTKKTI